MSGKDTAFLPEDVYDFLGHQVGVRTNARRVLEYLRSVYGRFYVGPVDQVCNLSPPRGDRSRRTIEITDDLESSDELVFKDPYQLYRLTDATTIPRLSRQYLNNPTRTQSCLLEFYSPLTFVGAATLGTVAQLLDDYFLFHAGAVSTFARHDPSSLRP